MVEQGRRQCCQGRWSIVAQGGQDLQEVLVVHATAKVGTDGVVEVEPMDSQFEQVVGVLGMQEAGSVELFVVGEVASFDAAIVGLATEGAALDVATEGVEVARGEPGDLGEVVAAELLAPVGLEGDVSV